VVLVLLIFVFNINFCFATDNNLKDAFGTKLEEVAGSSGAGYDTNDAVDAYSIISLAITTALSLLGVIFLVLMIYAGYNWMTARGEEEKVTKAKDTIMRAIIGLIIVVAAYAISTFVISKLETGVFKSSDNRDLKVAKIDGDYKIIG